MNTIKIAFALAAGLLLAVVGTPAYSAPIVQTVPTGELSASTFNSLFSPKSDAPAMTSSYKFMNTPESGVVQSQVFEGKGAAEGLYAYAFQIGVNNVPDSTGETTSVNSASIQFNATPVLSNFIDSSSAKYAAYVVSDGKIGGIDLPQAAPGSVVQDPTSIAWQPGTKTGSLTFQYLDALKNTGPLPGGSKSSTIVILSTQPFTTKPVSLQNANPQTSYPVAYSAEGGDIQEIPVPEPSTFLAWAGIVATGLIARRVRSSRSLV
jgi:hypothetical protein